MAKTYTELNAVFDLINNDEDTYKKTQMVNYTVELNKLVESGKFTNVKAIPTNGEILQQMYKSPVWKALQAQAGGELAASGSL